MVRNDFAAIYKQEWDGRNKTEKPPKSQKWYEVIKIQNANKDWYIKDKLISRSGDEFYPTNEQWGTCGWTYKNYDDAVEKIMNLREKKREFQV